MVTTRMFVEVVLLPDVARDDALEVLRFAMNEQEVRPPTRRCTDVDSAG